MALQQQQSSKEMMKNKNGKAKSPKHPLTDMVYDSRWWPVGSIVKRPSNRLLPRRLL